MDGVVEINTAARYALVRSALLLRGATRLELWRFEAEAECLESAALDHASSEWFERVRCDRRNAHGDRAFAIFAYRTSEEAPFERAFLAPNVEKTEIMEALGQSVLSAHEGFKAGRAMKLKKLHRAWAGSWEEGSR